LNTQAVVRSVIVELQFMFQLGKCRDILRYASFCYNLTTQEVTFKYINLFIKSWGPAQGIYKKEYIRRLEIKLQ